MFKHSKKIGVTTLLLISGFIGTGIFLSHQAEAQTAFTTPPFAEPSAYYNLPHIPLLVGGKYFTPGERILIQQLDVKTGKRTQIATAIADTSGNFTRNITPSNPYAYSSTTQTYIIEGETSNHPVQFSVIFGTYYPQITPSTYLATPGQIVTVIGRSFAPNEPVQIYGNGVLIGTTYAGINGVMNVDVRAPQSGKSFTVSARGGWSQKISARTITLSY